MKRKSISLAEILPSFLIIFVILVLPAKLLSQNTVIRWSTFDMGFATSVSSNTVVKSAVGQGFVGTMQQGNTRIESGLFADTLIRRNVTSAIEELSVPYMYSLLQNFPNPFNPTTTVRYSLPFDSKVLIRIYNILGQDVKLLKDEIVSAGNYEVQFNSSNLPSGIYFYRLSAESIDGKQKYSSTKKMILLK